ncbi:MAG TPA: hypothetical protein PLP23_10815 [Panacibacter sp.]|nr:hypothetical protein [Panacibacter sp.]
MHKNFPAYIICFFLAFTTCINAHAQDPDEDGGINPQTGLPNSTIFDNQGKPIRRNTDTTNNKLKHRDPLEDSITISYHYFDNNRIYKLDSSINDFFSRYPVPWYFTDLGNFGNATRPMLFTPFMKPGWDAGFHAYDQFRFTVEDTKLYNSTRPYTEMGYMLGSKAEQMINIQHTQKRKNNVILGFEYRLINAPGAFINQNTSHNNIRINLAYQSRNKRYANNLIYITNKLRSSENGGIQDDTKLSGLSFNDPFGVSTILGNASAFSRNFFSTNINTGTLYDESVILLRQSYDFGQKDSLVTDSVTYKLFYPRFRLQHDVQFKKEGYVFQDFSVEDSLYNKQYNYIPLNDSISFKDSWQSLTNDFSVISYPQKNNLNQFLKAGAGYEIITGGYDPYRTKYSNVYFAGEYRNRTKNKKWDLIASGRFYTAGSYAGDYEAYASLERSLDKNKGALQLGFQNVNRSPSAIFSKGLTAFPVYANDNFNKENISRAFATVYLKSLGLSLSGEYYIISNYVYFDDYFTAKQESSLFNVIHISAEKKIQLSKHWNWYIEAHVQQKTGNAPVNLPLVLMRNRFAFEGNFFKNLFLSTGFEVRYNTSYHADNYSPLNGQFFLQNEFSTANNSPDVNAFLHFRIKSFKGFIRLENLNTINRQDKFRFTKNNFAAPHYPERTLWFHVGIWWNFVN